MRSQHCSSQKKYLIHFLLIIQRPRISGKQNPTVSCRDKAIPPVLLCCYEVDWTHSYGEHCKNVYSIDKTLFNRASESVVFNSDQKIALRAAYLVIC